MNTQIENSKPAIYLLVLLASLTAFAPFVTDMYLPSLPSMMESFNATRSEVQLGLTTSMLGLAIGQLIIGPLSDKYGRKAPLLWTLGLFGISSALCIFSSGIELFIAMRFIQGCGASGGVVLSRSIATDLYGGPQLARIMAVIGAISGIAPVISPVAGGGILMLTSWRGIFAVLLAIGLILFLATFKMPESYPVEKRRPLSILQSFSQITELVKNKTFNVYTAMQFFSMAVFFGQIAASPFIFQNHFGFSEQGFSVFFAVNATFIGIFAFLSSKFRSPQKSTFLGSLICLLFSLFAAVSLALEAPVAVFEASMIGLMSGFGLLMAPMTTIAMNSAREQAGLASAVFGAAGFIAGGLASPIVGMGNLLYTPGIVYVVGSLLTFLTVIYARRVDSVS